MEPLWQWSKNRETWIACIILCLHFVFLLYFFKPLSIGPDAHGYLVQARLIAEDHQTWFKKEAPLQFSGHHWVQMDDRHFSRYPAGFPLLLVIPYLLGGPYLVFLMNPLLTTGTLMGLFLLCRKWVGPNLALIALTVMAVNSVANTWTFMGDAHPAVAFFLVWGIYWFALWSDSLSPWLAFFAGLWLGIIPTLRYAEAIYAPAFAIFLLMHLNQGRKAYVSVVAAAIGGSIPMAVLLAHNLYQFGELWRTGYELGFPIFGFNYFIQKIFPYIGMILVRGVGLFGIAGIAGIVWLCKKPETRPYGMLFLLLIVPITCLYMSYFFFDGSMRFLLPTFYIYVLAGTWFIKLLHGHRPKTAKVFANVSVIASLLLGIPFTVLMYMSMIQSNQSMLLVSNAVQKSVPSNSIIIAPYQLQQHLQFIGHWKLVEDTILSREPKQGPPPRQNRDNDRPDFMPRIADHSGQMKLMEKYATESGKISSLLIKDLLAWGNGKDGIYLINESGAIREMLSGYGNYEVAATLNLPKNQHHLPRRGPRQNVQNNNPQGTLGDEKMEIRPLRGDGTPQNGPIRSEDQDGSGRPPRPGPRGPGGPARGPMMGLDLEGEVIIVKLVF